MIILRACPLNGRAALGAIFAIALTFAVFGCGSSASIRARNPETAPVRIAGADADGDEDFSPDDNDNQYVIAYGRAATPDELHTITLLVHAYYHAAAREDGAAACGLLVASVASALVEDQGGPYGPSYLKGAKTCAQVLDKLFAHFRRTFVSESASFTVPSVRLKGGSGFAILRFSTGYKYKTFKLRPLRVISVALDHGQWRLATITDDPLP